MKFNLAKYAFTSKEQFDTKLALLYDVDAEGNKIPKSNFRVSELGNLVDIEATYDEEGVELTPVVYSLKWAVDMVWYGLDTHPTDWAIHSIIVLGNGKHSVSGLNYNDYKFTI